MVRPDEGGGGPTLNAKAKHYERELFKVFEVQVGSISMTQTNWQDAKKRLDDLSKDVGNVRGELAAPADGGKGWNGPAAEAALASLQKLSDTLDGHATKVADVDKSLGQIYTAVTEAKSAYYDKVASISTYVDPDSHKRLPAPYLPTADNIAAYSVQDPAAAAAAEDALWEERNQKAKGVLDKLSEHTETATATMPIKPKSDTETPYSNDGPAASNRTSGTASQSSTSGAFITGGHAVVTGQVHPVDNGNHTVTEVPTAHPLPPTEICTGYPTPVPTVDEVDYDPISSDGPTTGSTGVSPGTGTGGSTGSYPSGGGSGVGPGGIAAGGIGGAAGLGGLLGNRGGAGGMLSNGGTARGGATGARGNTAGVRGSAMRAGGGQAIPGGGGASARNGGSARGSAVKGATGSGRYGVPKLGTNGAVAGGGGQAGKGSGAGKGTPGARGGGRGGASMGAAGAGGGRKGDKNGQPEDVDKLTHEDEEKWFEGTEESSPQVWE